MHSPKPEKPARVTRIQAGSASTHPRPLGGVLVRAHLKGDDKSMTNEDWNSGNDGSDANAPKALREHADKLKQELAEEKAKTALLQAQVRTSAISGVLSSKGFNPKIATLIPETVEASEEKLTEWLTANADIFPPAAVGGSQGGSEPPKDEDPDEDHAGDDRMGRAVSMGLPLDRAKDVEARIATAKGPEDLEKIMSELSHVRFK